jgi:hypothetical protein
MVFSTNTVLLEDTDFGIRLLTTINVSFISKM